MASGRRGGGIEDWGGRKVFFFPGFCFVRWVFFLGGGGSDRGVLKG